MGFLTKENDYSLASKLGVIELSLDDTHLLDDALFSVDFRSQKVVCARHLKQEKPVATNLTDFARVQLLDQIGRESGRDRAGVCPLVPTGKHDHLTGGRSLP